MLMDARRWLIAAVVVVLVVGLVAFARGRTHHKGAVVGSTALGRPATAVAVRISSRA